MKPVRAYSMAPSMEQPIEFDSAPPCPQTVDKWLTGQAVPQLAPDLQKVYPNAE